MVGTVTEFGEHSLTGERLAPPSDPSAPEVLTPLLHEAEQVIQELFPLGVRVQFIELWAEEEQVGGWERHIPFSGGQRRELGRPHTPQAKRQTVQEPLHI